MRVQPSPRGVLQGLTKLIVIVAVAVALGLAIGLLLSKLSGNETSDASAPAVVPTTTTSAATSDTDEDTATTTTSPATTAPANALDLGDGLTLTADSASFTPATTPNGKARKRGRLTVKVTLENTGTADVTPDVKRLVVREGGVVTRPDPAADDVAGKLSQPLAAGDSVTGDLNFETAGAATAAIAKATSVQLRFGPKAVTVKLG